MTDPFSSARLIYRAVDIEHDKALFTAINNDHAGYVNSNANNIRLPGPADADRYMKYVANDTLLGAVICLPEGLKSGDTLIGSIHLSRLPPTMSHHRNTEIAIDILPSYQGQGYGSEAILWALDYAFKKVGLHRVSIRAFEWNKGAIRLYETLGFRHEGRGREAMWYEGKWWDDVGMGMLEGEWWELVKKRKGKDIEVNGVENGEKGGVKKTDDVKEEEE